MFFYALFCTFVSMNERINWIDWAKFLAVALVIPVHIPQALGDQPVTYFMVFLLACLMFNSGYLKKKRTNLKEEIKKYGYQLGIPYLIYNILFFPYWFIKFYSTHGNMPTLTDIMRPIYGTILLQSNNSFSEELNPVTWFIAALFIMHILLDICLRIKYGNIIMAILCLLSMGIYVAIKHGDFPAHYVSFGISKSLIFYYMGYLCQQHGIFKTCDFKKDAGWFIITLILSIVLFVYHANETNFPLHMLSYFPTVLFGLLAFIFFCKMLDGVHSKIVVNFSNGTMVFIGLHWMMVGTIRYGILKPFFHVSGDYTYTSLEAYTLGLVVTLLLYPIILFLQAKAPWMLGKRTMPSIEA